VEVVAIAVMIKQRKYKMLMIYHSMKGGVKMGCCGGGHNQHNQNFKKSGVNHKEENTSNGSIITYLIGGLLILGLLAVYFIK